MLLDEVEKAHPDVLELFYSVFDTGELDDAEGLSVDFRNCIFLLTSNLGSHIILDSKEASLTALTERVRPHLERHFSAALLARMTPIPYVDLKGADYEQIAKAALASVVQRVQESQAIRTSYDEATVHEIVRRCLSRGNGARSVEHVLSHEILPGISSVALEWMARGETCRWMHISVASDHAFVVRGHSEVLAGVTTAQATDGPGARMHMPSTSGSAPAVPTAPSDRLPLWGNRRVADLFRRNG